MKRVLQIISGTIVGMSCMSGVAMAATSNCPTGTIVNGNGSGSTNTISCITTTDTHVTCVNDIYVVGQNGQAASTGGSTANGNTGTGVVVTGDATNDNNQKVQVGASCGQVSQATTSSSSTSVTPATPAGGKGAAAPAPATVKVLPATGSSDLVRETVTGAAVIAGTLAISQLGIQTYRRLALK